MPSMYFSNSYEVILISVVFSVFRFEIVFCFPVFPRNLFVAARVTFCAVTLWHLLLSATFHTENVTPKETLNSSYKQAVWCA